MRTLIPKCDSSKVAKQLYLNRTSAWVCMFSEHQCGTASETITCNFPLTKIRSLFIFRTYYVSGNIKKQYVHAPLGKKKRAAPAFGPCNVKHNHLKMALSIFIVFSERSKT